jgi:hypothetical protein
METSSPPHPSTNLSTHLYYQVVYTLTDLLPPPLDNTPDALRTRNRAAIAKVASMLPVNANEVDLAAQCIAARAQAEDILRLLRENTDDIHLVMRLNAQYSSMVRTSLSVHGRLMRVQAARQKREAIEGAATEDAWTLHIAEQSMLKVAEPHIERPNPAPRPAQAEAPVARVDHMTDENVSEIEQIFMDRLLRRMRDDAPEPDARRSNETGPPEMGREAMATAAGRGTGKQDENTDFTDLGHGFHRVLMDGETPQTNAH